MTHLCLEALTLLQNPLCILVSCIEKRKQQIKESRSNTIVQINIRIRKSTNLTLPFNYSFNMTFILATVEWFT